jgi:hypothetical protein
MQSKNYSDETKSEVKYNNIKFKKNISKKKLQSL